MSNDKLSELSKPVAWVTMQREFCDDERSVITNEVAAEKYSLDCYDLTPLYSQEYVSALLADNEALKIRVGQQQSVAANNLDMFRKADERAESLLAELESKSAYAADWCHLATKRKDELEDANKRIADLERANQSQDDHINQQQDRIDSLEKTNAGLGRGLAAAEQKLATQVRLPELCGDGENDNEYTEGLNDGINQSAKAIRAAGFKCEGYE